MIKIDPVQRAHALQILHARGEWTMAHRATRVCVVGIIGAGVALGLTPFMGWELAALVGFLVFAFGQALLENGPSTRRAAALIADPSVNWCYGGKRLACTRTRR